MDRNGKTLKIGQRVWHIFGGIWYKAKVSSIHDWGCRLRYLGGSSFDVPAKPVDILSTKPATGA
jgi:hypothetical protein